MTAIREAQVERCGKAPIRCHCHNCGHEWTIGWTPCLLDHVIEALTNVSCPSCTDGAVRLGPRCQLVEERAYR